MTAMVRRFLSSAILRTIKRSYTPPLVLTLISVALLTVAALICLNALGPHGDPKPSVTDWISAVGQAAGALLTGGAVIYAARTYDKQRQDKHDELEDRRQEEERKRKEQTDKIIVRVERGLPDGKTLVDVKNSTNLPIFKMNLYAINVDGRVIDAQPLSQEVVVGDYPGHQFENWANVHSAYAEFTDSAGVAWIRTSKGTLVEKGKEPDGFDPREMPKPGDPMHTYMGWY